LVCQLVELMTVAPNRTGNGYWPLGIPGASLQIENHYTFTGDKLAR
jgi:hypothetical protein